MTYKKRMWLAGLAGGLVVGLAVGWVLALSFNAVPSDFCTAVEAASAVTTIGTSLLVDLDAWIIRAQDLLTLELPASPETREGLGGLLDRAKDVAEAGVAGAVNALTAPLTDLLDLARSLLDSVREAVEAADKLLEALEDRC